MKVLPKRLMCTEMYVELKSSEAELKGALRCDSISWYSVFSAALSSDIWLPLITYILRNHLPKLKFNLTSTTLIEYFSE